MISFNNVSKVYETGGQSVHAVEDVTLSVEKGEILALSVLVALERVRYYA